MENKKSNTVLIIVVSVLCTLVVGGFCFYLGMSFADKEDNLGFKKNENNKTQENNRPQENNQTPSGNNNQADSNTIPSEMQRRIYGHMDAAEMFLEMKGSISNKGASGNLLDEEYNTLYFLTYYYYESGDYTYTKDADIQASAYKSYEEFSTDYNRLFEKTYGSLNKNDAENFGYSNCTGYASLQGGDYVCWLYSISHANEVDLEVERISRNGDTITVTAELDLDQADRDYAEGTATFKYKIVDNKEYLESITYNITQIKSY